MLEPDQWDRVLSRARGTVYRSTKRISSNALLTLLEVGPDPVIRQKVANVNFFRSIVTFPRGWRPEFALRRPLEFPTVPSVGDLHVGREFLPLAFLREVRRGQRRRPRYCD